MKYVLVVIGLLFGAYAEAGEPTKSDLDAFAAAIETEQDKNMWFFQTGKPCFFEHICTMGPIGKQPDCETRIEICLIQAAEDRDEYDEERYNRLCRPRFSEFTPAQNALVRSPKFCEAAPPPIAFKPTLAPSETACYCKKYANLLGDLEGVEENCLQDVEKCTRSMHDLSGPDRSRCREKRDLALGGHTPWFTSTALGSCKLVLDYPVLWDENQSPIDTSSQSVQALERAHPELQDETDLDGLGF